VLALAKAGSEKPLYALHSAYITAVEKVLDYCASWFDKVNGMSSTFFRSLILWDLLLLVQFGLSNITSFSLVLYVFPSVL